MIEKLDYGDFIALAIELIGEAGEDVVWQKPASVVEGSSPWRDERGVGIPTSFPATIAFFSPLDLARGRGQFAMFNSGTDIMSYTEVGLLAGACGFLPEVTDRLLRNGETVEIVEIDKIAPNGVPILYYVSVK